uniref:Uncharacterized protein n=1 Tax=Fagus sylvatica TaxID=28930 RepID=A0A2N9J2I1_FAGSY
MKSVQPEHLTTAHKRPTPRPRLEGDAHPAGHAAKERTTPACRQALPCPIPAGLEVTHPCRSRPGRERPTPRPSLPPGVAVPDPCRFGGHPSVPISAWPVPAVPMNSILQRKGHRKVELGLEVVEPCRLVAEKILVAEINLK